MQEHRCILLFLLEDFLTGHLIAKHRVDLAMLSNDSLKNFGPELWIILSYDSFKVEKQKV
jgi:hypothetical protein